MQNAATQILNYLWNQSWQIALLTIILVGASLLLKNKSAHIRYLLWLILLVKCVVPPLITIPIAVLPQQKTTETVLPTAIQATPINVTVKAAGMTPAESWPQIITPKFSLLEKLSQITVYQWLVLGWITGTLIFAAITVIKALRLNNWLRKSRRELPADLQEIIINLFAELKIVTLPKLWLIEGIGQPFVWGLFRGSIYLPAGFAEIENSSHRRGILGHELSHILRFDAAVNFLQIITQAIFWFHPFVWWANKEIRAEREKCCDEIAIAKLGTKPKDYSTAIVNTLITEHKAAFAVPSLAVAGPVKNIEDRIKTIMIPNKKFHEKPGLMNLLIAITLFIVIIPTSIALTTPRASNQDNLRTVGTNNQEDIQFLTQINVFRIGQKSTGIKYFLKALKNTAVTRPDPGNRFPDIAS